MNESNPKKDYFLPASIIIAALLISFSLVYNTGKKAVLEEQQDQKNKPLYQIDLREAVFLGSENAPVVLIEYGDYQCPFCTKWWEEVKPFVVKEYINTGKVKMVYKDLVFLGPESFSAALAARCAAEQNSFWTYHDALYEVERDEDLKDDNVFNGSAENSGNLKRELFIELAKKLNLDESKFISCFDSQKYKNLIEKEIEEAKQVLERTATPSFFINNRLIQGFLPFEGFRRYLDEELKNI